MKKYLLLTLLCCFLLGTAMVAYLYLATEKKQTTTIPPYFTYTEAELTPLRELKSNQSITTEDVYLWDQVMYDLVSKNTPKQSFTEETSKIYAYLTVAQRDFYALTYAVSGENSGTFDHLSRDVLCLFFVEDCGSIITRGEKDTYSDAIGRLILSRVKARIATDNAQLTAYEIKEGEQYWNGPAPYTGVSNGSSLGWFIESGDQFRAVPPPDFSSEAFKEQLTITETALKNATKEQKEAVVFWAGGPGTKTPPGQLLQLGDTYAQDQNIPLEKVLLVRSVLTMAVADAVTAVFDSKYTYQVKRPFMRNPSLITIMPTPNHPSYPAGHSTLSTAAATVLNHYFPEHAAYWNEMTTESGMSRIWGGIHYMMDHEAGVLIGTQVGQTAIQKTNWNSQ